MQVNGTKMVPTLPVLSASDHPLGDVPTSEDRVIGVTIDPAVTRLPGLPKEDVRSHLLRGRGGSLGELENHPDDAPGQVTVERARTSRLVNQP